MTARNTRAPRVGMLNSLFTLQSSFSVPRLLTRTESVIARHYETRLLAPEVPHLDTRRRRARLEAFLRECDAAVVPAVISSRHLLEVFAARPRPDFPIVYLPVGELPRGAMMFRRAFRRFGRQDVIAISCEADLKIIQRLVSDVKARVRLVPYGVDTDAYAPLGAEERRAVRSSLGYSPTDVVLFYVGRVTAEKNVHALVALYQHLAKMHPRVKLIVDGPLRDDPFYEFGTGPLPIDRLLKAQVRADPATAGGVRFIQAGERPVPLETLCAASDIFVNLTLNHDENFGLALVEAMSCGLPVVGSAWGGQKDTVTDGEVGFLAEALPSGRGFAVDFPQAAEACRRLIQSPGLRRRMGAKGRQRALELYSLDAYASHWRALLEDCLRPPSQAKRANRLSAFGRRFQGAFSEPAHAWQKRASGGKDWASWPFYPEGDEGGQALYRELIRPYGGATSPLDSGDVLFLRSPFTRRSGRAIRVNDPLWPGALSPVERGHGWIVEALRDGFRKVESIRREVGERFEALLDPLIKEGVVVRSAQPNRRPTRRIRSARFTYGP